LIVTKLSSTQLFKDYQKAFSEATGLQLAIRPAQSFDNALKGTEGENPLCVLLAETSEGCANCVKIQEELELKAGLGPESLNCFAGLSDSAVPIRVDNEVVAFLQTGQILLHQPDEEEFKRTIERLEAAGSQIDLRALEAAYFQTKVFDGAQYNAMLRLLSVFADQLAAIGNRIETDAEGAQPKLVSKAKRYIRDHFSERISLDEAAQAVNSSTRHFCKVFKEATGITFTDYLARVRVEEAQNLLQNPHLRVSEIAFETGFESISQFNRSFKRVTGKTPTQFRD
jgi:AraC-like DNA-binding protein/ligand-binding sensor protein